MTRFTPYSPPSPKKRRQQRSKELQSIQLHQELQNIIDLHENNPSGGVQESLHAGGPGALQAELEDILEQLKAKRDEEQRRRTLDELNKLHKENIEKRAKEAKEEDRFWGNEGGNGTHSEQGSRRTGRTGEERAGPERGRRGTKTQYGPSGGTPDAEQRGRGRERKGRGTADTCTTDSGPSATGPSDTDPSGADSSDTGGQEAGKGRTDQKNEPQDARRERAMNQKDLNSSPAQKIQPYEEYCRKWELVEQSEGSLVFSDIPWPTLDASCIGEKEVKHFYTSSGKDTRQMVRAELLRWHPDKFGPKYLPRVQLCDRDRVKEKDDLVSRCLNELLVGGH
ncbi:hypothetical protein EIP86_008938 [Pleurotus ostreatoroseus]|nr:hypothetical protein EIP86_008938 [Pleurotus ostreatoroseus]